jgi:hypothetical protein
VSDFWEEADSRGQLVSRLNYGGRSADLKYMMVDAKASRHQLSGDLYSAVVMPAELYDLTNLLCDNGCVVWRSIVAEVAFSG